MAAQRKPLALPHDMVVEIAACIAATSPHPVLDICNLRATCQAMRVACKEGAVESRVALEREESMRWNDHGRYLALVDNLAAAGNPEACFVLGLTLVFAQRRTTAKSAGIEWLRRSATAGHKVAAYVLGVLHYGDKQAEQYIRQVEDETASDGCNRKVYKTNNECVRCREQAFHAVREVTWNVTGAMDPTPMLVPPAVVEDDQAGCKASGCGMPEGWSGGCIFCSDRCRIRYEYSKFFSRVSLPVV